MAHSFLAKTIVASRARWTIDARITSKSLLRPCGNDGQGLVFTLRLLDSEGGDIRAKFFTDATTKFFEQLEVNKVYKFSRGTARLANERYNNTRSKYELIFDSDAQIEQVMDAKVHKATFNFTDIQNALSKPMPCRVDLCGVVMSFRQSSSFIAKDGRKLTKRAITIVDDTSTSMDVTLWEDYAKVSDSCFEGKPVVAIKGIDMREWKGGRCGDTTCSSVLEFGPDFPEAKRLAMWWSQFGKKESSFNLVDISSIQSIALPCCVDVAGIITRFGPLMRMNSKDGPELVMRAITIMDQSGLRLDVTLWGDMGQDKEFNGNPVVVLTHILVKEWNGGCSASTTDSSSVYLNPMCKTAESLRRWWSQDVGSRYNIANLNFGVARYIEECSSVGFEHKYQHQSGKLNASIGVEKRP